MGAVRNLSISAFFGLCIVITLIADNLDYLNETFGNIGSKNQLGEVSQEFANATFFSVGNSNKSMEVNSLKVRIQSSDGKIFLDKPFGSIMSSGELIKYQGDSGEVFPSKEQINLFGNVKFQKPELLITGEKMMVFQKKQSAELIKNVQTRARTKKGDKIKIRSKSAFFEGEKGVVRYDGAIKGNINFNNKEFSPPLLFQSETLDYFLNSGQMNLKGMVKLNRDKVKLRSQRGSIFLSRKNKTVSYFELSDDVRFSETFIASNGESILRTGLSQKLEGFGFEKKLIFSGFPKVKQFDDLIQGNTIVIRESDELVEIINTNSKFKFNK